MSTQSFDEGAARTGVARSETTQDAAEGVLADVLGDFARTDSRPEVREAAVEHLGELGALGDQPDAAVRDVIARPSAGSDAVSATSAQQTSAAHETDEIAAASLQPEGVQALLRDGPDIPEDVAVWLAEEIDDEDVDRIVEEELAADRARAQEEGDDEELMRLDDEEDGIRRERAARIKAERRADALEQRIADASRGKWEDEVKRAKLVISPKQLAGITATSRRGYWREAKRIHDTNAEVLAPFLEQLPAAAAATTQEAREAAAAAWGQPVRQGAGEAPSGASPQDVAARVAASRRGQSFVERIREMGREGKVQL